MRKIIVCLIFLISFSNAIQCYNGKTYVDIPESKLSDIGYTKYNITHSNFDCKMAYKRYLKVKEIEPVNVHQVIKSEKLKEGPSKIGHFLPIFLLVIIVCVIWKNYNTEEEVQENYIKYIIQKDKSEAQIKPKSNDTKEDELTLKKIEYFDTIIGKTYSVKPTNEKTEPVKSWNDLSKEYSENLKKIEKERQKSDKTYDELLTKQEWYNFRNKVIYDRGYVCEFCKKKHNLQVHHKLYYKKPNKEKIEPWLYNMNEVLLLCDSCHKSAHKKNKIKVYYISYDDYDKRKVGFYNDFKQS